MQISLDDYVEGQLNNSIAFEADADDAFIIVQALCGFYSGDSITVTVRYSSWSRKVIHGQAGSRELDAALDKAIRS